MMCPCEEHTHDMHVARDRQIVAESGANAMYYDISANNLLHVCLKEDHHHPKGGGNELTKAYRRIYRDTKEACAEAKNDRYFPVGTEMINESFPAGTGLLSGTGRCAALFRIGNVAL